ncbi:MAG: hypothetical protein PHI34_04520 [Acidobacteriota bacterium]|nr:hypothetical protein [Acidobacteriota bacterium]
MLHKSVAAVILVFVLILLASLPARAQEIGYPFKWSNFRIELTGGWARISPKDLNRAVDYENAYLNHYYLDRYAYYDDLYGDAYSARYVYSGAEKFESLRSITALGAAIRYQLSPTFALSLGVQSLRGAKSSGVGLDVVIDDARPEAEFPGTSTASYANDDLTVSIKSWMPYLAANFGWDLFKFLRSEIFFLGGPIFGDVRAWNKRNESILAAEETVSSGSRTMELTGRATSIGIELGGQLRFKLFPFLEIYGQASYAFRQLNQIQGLYSLLMTSELPTASETLYTAEGTWGVRLEKAGTPWGLFSAQTLTTEWGTEGWTTDSYALGATGASVDLSGFHLTAGISIRI